MFLFLNCLNEFNEKGNELINLDCVKRIYMWVNKDKQYVLQVYYKKNESECEKDYDDGIYENFYIATQEDQEFFIEQLKKIGLK